MKKNKIVLFVLALILLAGIIVVCLKGFNVSLNLRAHDTLKFVFDKKFQMEDVTKVCDEVFKDKEYEIKTVEVFSDAVYIISPLITTNEEEALLEKLNDLYSTDDTANSNTETSDKTEENEVTEPEENNETQVEQQENQENTEKTIFDQLEEGSKYKLYHDSKIRIRDIVKPYIIPSIICSLICLVYIGVKYRKLGNPIVLVCKTLGEMMVIFLEVLSIIAITRIEFTSTIVPIVMLIVVVSLCIRLAMYEKKLVNLNK